MLKKKLQAFVSDLVKNKVSKLGSTPLSFTGNGVDLANYRFYGNSVEEQLPQGYTPLAYIESDGSQYIQTSIIPSNYSNNLRIKARVNQTTKQNTTSYFVGGNTNGGRFCNISLNANNNWDFYGGGATASQVFDIPSDFYALVNTWYDIDCTIKNGDNTSKVIINGREFNGTGIEATSTSPFVIFALNAVNTTGSFKGKIRYITFINPTTNETIANFVAAKNSSEVLGLYDTVSDTFFPNQGTGDFIAGLELPQATVKDCGDEIGANSYEIPVVISGKNVWDKSKESQDLSAGVAGYSRSRDIVFSNSVVRQMLLPSTTYRISFDIECVSVPQDSTILNKAVGFTLINTNNPAEGIGLYKAAEVYEGYTSHYSQKFTTPANLLDQDKSYVIRFYTNKREDNNTGTEVFPTVKFTNIQIEEGNIETAYEPYYTSENYSIYLDAPLRKVGNYADYIDFCEQKVYRNVAVVDSSDTLPIAQRYEGVFDSVGTSISLPTVLTFNNTTILDASTQVKPSGAYIDLSYYNLASWVDIHKIVNRGYAPRVFNIGDQLEVRRGSDTLIFYIIGFDHDVEYFDEATQTVEYYPHSMTLQCRTSVVRFDTEEAMFYIDETTFPNGLEGDQTYYFLWNDNIGSISKGYFQFQLAMDVPVGGQIIISPGSSTGMTSHTITTYASAEDTIPLEENVAITSGSDGTYLGQVRVYQFVTDNVNCGLCGLFGSSRWSTSCVRQRLNSDKAANTWWQPQTVFDRPTNANADGFLYNMEPEFLNILGMVMKKTQKGRAWNYGLESTNDKVFLLSLPEVYGGTERAADGADGTVYEYYAPPRSDLNSPGTGNDTNRIKYNSSGTATKNFLRTSYTLTDYTSVYTVRAINNNGSIVYMQADLNYPGYPACVIV